MQQSILFNTLKKQRIIFDFDKKKTKVSQELDLKQLLALLKNDFDTFDTQHEFSNSISRVGEDIDNAFKLEYFPLTSETD